MIAQIVLLFRRTARASHQLATYPWVLTGSFNMPVQLVSTRCCNCIVHSCKPAWVVTKTALPPSIRCGSGQLSRKQTLRVHACQQLDRLTLLIVQQPTLLQVDTSLPWIYSIGQQANDLVQTQLTGRSYSCFCFCQCEIDLWQRQPSPPLVKTYCILQGSLPSPTS